VLGFRSHRRDFLKLGVTTLATAAALPRCSVIHAEGDNGCDLVEGTDQPLRNADWVQRARVAGLAGWGDETICELSDALDQMKDENVSVVELDPDLSNYLDEPAFAQQLTFLDMAARECHRRGMRAVAYYPIGESLTPDADNTPHTTSKDHPDWVQINMDGSRNVFVGGEGNVSVFWVEQGVESCWMCPASGYRDYFNARAARIAKTALDGLWGDVPLLSDIAGYWPCINDSCKAKFLADTGLVLPSRADWSDPVFRRWVVWRHALVHELEQSILASVKAVRSDFELIIETVTMDYNGGTTQGLDAAAFDDAGLYRVFEVDAYSDTSGMRNAMIEDWATMAIMMKQAKGAAAPRPAWIFCYGKEEDDAEQVMALAIAAGCNPYETQIPETNTSVGHDYRKRMFDWLGAHDDVLTADSEHDVAVLYSSVSRDCSCILDRPTIDDSGRKIPAIGLYASIPTMGDEEWWTDKASDSAKLLNYIGDYRGVCAMLIDGCIPFDIVTTPHATPDVLQKYKVVIAPSLFSVSADLVGALEAFVRAGGTLIFTGTDAASYDALAQPLVERPDLFAIEAGVGGWSSRVLGAGRVIANADRMGHAYYQKKSEGTKNAFVGLFSPGRISTTAHEGVLFELRSPQASSDVLQIVIANPLAFYSRTATFDLDVDVGGAAVSKVIVSRPDEDAIDVSLPFTASGTRIRFTITMTALASVAIQR
jgi:hypothetical protein